MRLASISIKNFRGIKVGNFVFPLTQRLFCVIGAGDSCKSTLLKAIEWCLWPTWNVAATDLDFYNGDTSNPIVIEGSIADIPEELLTEDKFGLYLRDLDAVIAGEENDEPIDGSETVITIRLTIDESLEPVWKLITNRTEPHSISQKDRRMFPLGIVGDNYEKDFVWGRTSVLQSYSDTSNDTLHTAYTQAMRAAVEKIDLTSLDQTTGSIKNIGKQYGVAFNGNIYNRLLMQNGSYSTTVGVFDDKVPFSQRGLGSKRLLSMGMNIHASTTGSVILIDEIETGLEPFRLCTLINHLRSEVKEKGQIIFTTHSRSAVCECTVDELYIINEKNGVVSWSPIADQDTKDMVQSLIRTEPDAFLCKRIIVCEGKTEVGLLRAFDEYLYGKSKSRFAYHGVGIALGGGGDKFFKLAKLLKKCGYDVCILMDSDISKEEQEKQEVETFGIKVFSWEEGNAIEEQIFLDATINCVMDLINLGIENKGFSSVKAQLLNGVKNVNTIFTFGKDTITIQGRMDSKSRLDIGKVAKGNSWYKRIDLGQIFGNTVFRNGRMTEGCHFLKVMDELKKWVNLNES